MLLIPQWAIVPVVALEVSAEGIEAEGIGRIGGEDLDRGVGGGLNEGWCFVFVGFE